MKYLKIYENVLSPHLCSALIHSFESNPDLHTEFDDEYKKFTQYSLSKLGLLKEVLPIILQLFNQYKHDCNLFPYQVPKDYGYEGLRIKKYYDKSCSFEPHVDVLSLESSKRFVSFLFYLNEEFDEGETIFYKNDEIKEDLIIKPKTGSCVMFPPLWTYPHKGNNPKNGDKYIMSSYINFIS